MTGEGLLSTGDSVASIRRSSSDDTSLFRAAGADKDGRVIVLVVACAVAVRPKAEGVEGILLNDCKIGREVSCETALEFLPSSQGSLLRVAPGASFVGRDDCSLAFWGTVMVLAPR